MKTYFEKNETTECKCGEQKLKQEIFCYDCANYWASNVCGKGLTFKNSNGSVKWMNAMLTSFQKQKGYLMDGDAKLFFEELEGIMALNKIEGD